jgi:hypothetical protein
MKFYLLTPYAGQTTSSYISSQPITLSLSRQPNIYNNPASGSQLPGGYAVSFTNQSSYPIPQNLDRNPTSVSGPSQSVDAAGISGSSTQNQQFVSSKQGGTYNPTPQDTIISSNNSEYLFVNVTKVPRTLYPDKFIFSNQRGYKRTTIKSDWTRITYNGRIV